MIIAVDFDGTICKQMPWKKSNSSPVGPLIEGSKEYINKLYDDGHTIIIWTLRHDKNESGGLQPMIDFLIDNGVKFHTINCNSMLGFETSNKIYYDVLVDDRAVGGMLPWCLIYKLITTQNNHYLFNYMKSCDCSCGI